MNLEGDLKTAYQGMDDQGAVFCFPRDLALFQGHFPGQPILPGIAQIEMVRHTLGRITGVDHALVRIKKTKFMHLISPETPVGVTLNSTPMDDGKKQVRATLKAKDQILAKLTLILKEIRE